MLTLNKNMLARYYLARLYRDHVFGTYAKIFEKLTFLIPDTHMYVYAGVRNISFSEDFA